MMFLSLLSYRSCSEEMLGRGQVGTGGWKEVLSKMQKELRSTRAPLSGPGERAVEHKGRGAKRPDNPLPSLPCGSKIVSNEY